MKLNQLETFVHVATHGSFSKAALVLGVAQPALSRQVRALETELREVLLLRHGRGITLTDAGQRLFAHGQEILGLVAQAKTDILTQRDEPSGKIIIAIPPTLARQVTPEIITAFRRDMPRARLAVVEGFSVVLTEWLLTGRVDLALVHNPEPLPALDITPLRREPFRLISPAKGAPGQPMTLQDLARLDLIMPQSGNTFRTQVESAAAMAGVQPRIRWEVSSVPTILDLVAAGIGHAVLSENAVHATRQAHLFAITPFTDTDIASTLCLVSLASKRPSPLMLRTAALLRALVVAA